MTPTRTIVYIDGYNLYYRAVKGTPYKWLDLFSLARLILPGNDVVLVKYFTARISGADDPGRPIRQQTFIRAIQAVGSVEVHYGLFASHIVPRPLPGPRPRKIVRVIDTKEKGSDVNLASHLITDAWLNKYDVAVIISNDSDQATAIRLVKDHTHKVVGIVNPDKGRMAAELSRLADFKKQIREKHLIACQMPNCIPGTSLVKPKEW